MTAGGERRGRAPGTASSKPTSDARKRTVERGKADARLRAALAGDRRALESVVAELVPCVFSVARAVARGDADVAHISHEAIVRIIRGLPRRRRKGTLRTWASAVTARVAFEHLRKNRSRIRQKDADADLTAVGEPSADLEDRAAVRSAAAVLGRLPATQRQALAMHHVLELPVREIARELGLPHETVRRRLRLAMRRARAWIAGRGS